MLTWEELKADKGRKLSSFAACVDIRRRHPRLAHYDGFVMDDYMTHYPNMRAARIGANVARLKELRK